MGSLDFSFVTIAAIPVTGTPGGPSIAPVVVVDAALVVYVSNREIDIIKDRRFLG